MAQKAPGKHYREGMSLVEVNRQFPDDAAAERWFTKVRWPDGAHCPHCGSVNVQDGTKHKTMPYRCRGLPQVVLGQDRDRHAVVEAGLAGVGRGVLPADHGP